MTPPPRRGFDSPYLSLLKTPSLAEGISCYRNGVQYAHGGLSLQECVTVSMSLRSGKASLGNVQITKIKWNQLICKVEVSSPIEGVTLDVRTHAGNATTTQVASKNRLKNKSKCSVIIKNEDLEGHECWVVLLDDYGNVLAQESTVVGEET